MYKFIRQKYNKFIMFFLSLWSIVHRGFRSLVHVLFAEKISGNRYFVNKSASMRLSVIKDNLTTGRCEDCTGWCRKCTEVVQNVHCP